MPYYHFAYYQFKKSSQKSNTIIIDAPSFNKAYKKAHEYVKNSGISDYFLGLFYIDKKCNGKCPENDFMRYDRNYYEEVKDVPEY